MHGGRVSFSRAGVKTGLDGLKLAWRGKVVTMARPPILILTAAVASVCAAASFAATSPAALERAILRAADAQRSVHYTSVQTWPARGLRIAMIGDAGRTKGIQRITFTHKGKTGHVVAVVVTNTVYVRGDAFTLHLFMAFSTAVAKKYAGRWIELPSTSAGFKTVAAGVRLRSTISELKLSSPLARLAPTTIDGTRVIGLRGQMPGPSGQSASGSVYARAGGLPLPVRTVASHGGITMTVVFSRWNEPVSIPSTRGATPISKLGTGTTA